MKLLIPLAVSVLTGLVAALPASAAEDSPLKTQQDKVSYALGMNIGKQLKQNEVEINLDIYVRGLQDALKDGKPLLTEDEARQTMTQFQTDLRQKQMAKAKVESDKNKKEGEAFLAENKQKEGVKTTPSGLQYKVVVKGDGPLPTTNDTVVTHYRGTLLDGTEFDSSYKRSEPATFPVTGVIKGWTEALLMMPVGSKWQLFIPSDLAYGERSRPSIPANSTLLFDIELIEIKKPGAAAAEK
jgi:FKBP-type peptidyl-prolyl cis-trans isomerase FklB